tara:strand:+ start:788 stop:1090 length:303 start_codon:yes stop_codon:yes gene_type:complete
MSDLTGAPDQVIEVHNAMINNAYERYNDEDPALALRLVYTRPEVTNTDNWMVSCNFEGWGPTMIFKTGVWHYRSRSTGEDEMMASGHEEALGNANCFFTG